MITWNGQVSGGSPAPSGVYLAVLESDNRQSIEKFTILR